VESEPQILPAVELRGSPTERLETLDATIVHLLNVRSALVGEPAGPPPFELHGRYLNAPSWPWFAAGCVLGALFVLLFVLAWSWS